MDLKNKKISHDRINIHVMSRLHRVVMFAVMAVALVSCSVKYSFNGASIDYSKTKTIEIADFPIRSSYVWAPMGSIFNNQLKDIYNITLGFSFPMDPALRATLLFKS